MLTDSQIIAEIKNGDLKIEPFDESLCKAGKYDFHLGNIILKPKSSNEVLDPASPEHSPLYERIDITNEPYILKPGEFVLGQTLQTFGLSDDLCGIIDGSTTLARIGLTIHETAFFIPPGQDPHVITVEFFNAGIWSIKLSYKLRIGKFIVLKYSEKNKIPARSYNIYNGQKETTTKFVEGNKT